MDRMSPHSTPASERAIQTSLEIPVAENLTFPVVQNPRATREALRYAHRDLVQPSQPWIVRVTRFRARLLSASSVGTQHCIVSPG
jgi:hypothetical protein